MKLNKCLSIALSVLMFANVTLASDVVYGAEGVKVFVDSKAIVSDVDSVIDAESGRVLVPMRAIFEAMGHTVYWEEVVKTVVAKSETPTTDTFVSVFVGDLQKAQIYVQHIEWKSEEMKKLKQEGEQKLFHYFLPLDNKNPVKIIDGRIMLPTRIIAELLGAKVEWIDETKTVNINTQGAKMVVPEGVIGVVIDEDKQTPTATPAPTPTPTNTIKVYKVFDVDGNRVSEVRLQDKSVKIDESLVGYRKTGEYVYKNPTLPKVAPVVGSLPASKLTENPLPYLSMWEARTKIHDKLEQEMIDKMIKEGNVRPFSVNPKRFQLALKEYVYSNEYEESAYEKLKRNIRAKENEEVPWVWDSYFNCRFLEVYGVPLEIFISEVPVEFYRTKLYFDNIGKNKELIAKFDKTDVVSYSEAIFNYGEIFIEYVERDKNNKPLFVYFTEVKTQYDEKLNQHVTRNEIIKVPFSEYAVTD